METNQYFLAFSNIEICQITDRNEKKPNSQFSYQNSIKTCDKIFHLFWVYFVLVVSDHNLQSPKSLETVAGIKGNGQRSVVQEPTKVKWIKWRWRSRTDNLQERKDHYILSLTLKSSKRYNRKPRLALGGKVYL